MPLAQSHFPQEPPRWPPLWPVTSKMSAPIAFAPMPASLPASSGLTLVLANLLCENLAIPLCPPNEVLEGHPRDLLFSCVRDFARGREEWYPTSRRVRKKSRSTRIVRWLEWKAARSSVYPPTPGPGAGKNLVRNVARTQTKAQTRAAVRITMWGMKNAIKAIGEPEANKGTFPNTKAPVRPTKDATPENAVPASLYRSSKSNIANE